MEILQSAKDSYWLVKKLGSKSKYEEQEAKVKKYVYVFLEVLKPMILICVIFAVTNIVGSVLSIPKFYLNVIASFALLVLSSVVLKKAQLERNEKKTIFIEISVLVVLCCFISYSGI